MNVEHRLPVRVRTQTGTSNHALAWLNGNLGIMERGNRSVNYPLSSILYPLSSILFPINGAFA